MNQQLKEIYCLLDRLAKNGAIEAEINAEGHGSEDYRLYYDVYDKLDDVYRLLRYLDKSIEGIYLLYKNDLGRYEAFSGCYYTSGTPIEFWYEDRWHMSRVEFGEDDYYIVHFHDVSMENLKVRVRGSF